MLNHTGHQTIQNTIDRLEVGVKSLKSDPLSPFDFDRVPGDTQAAFHRGDAFFRQGDCWIDDDLLLVFHVKDEQAYWPTYLDGGQCDPSRLVHQVEHPRDPSTIDYINEIDRV